MLTHFRFNTRDDDSISNSSIRALGMVKTPDFNLKHALYVESSANPKQSDRKNRKSRNDSEKENSDIALECFVILMMQ